MEIARGSIPAPEEWPVLAAAGNSEMKAVTLASIELTNPLSGMRLRDRVMELQGDNPAWPTLAASTVNSYCDTFSKAGLVEAANGYVLTRAGTHALPRIGWLLDLSLAHDPPLYGYFGPTARFNADASWASERRVKMLRLLKSMGERQLSMTTVSEHIDANESTTLKIVDDLVLYGLISASERRQNKPAVSYFTTNTIFERTARTPFAQDLLDILVMHHAVTPDQPFTTREIADRLILYGYESEPGLISRINSRMSQLAEKSGALRVERLYNRGIRSVVWASQEQLQTIDAFFEALGRRPDISGLNRLAAILDDEASVNHLLAKGRDAAAGIKRFPEAQDRFHAELRSVLQAASGPLTLRSIWELLMGEGIKYDSTTIKNKLHNLLDLGHVSAQDTPSGHVYSWVNAPPIPSTQLVEARQEQIQPSTPVTRIFDRQLTQADFLRLGVSQDRIDNAMQEVAAANGVPVTELVDESAEFSGTNLQKMLITLFGLRVTNAENFLGVRTGLIEQFATRGSRVDLKQGLITDPVTWDTLLREFRPDKIEFSPLPDQPPGAYGFEDTDQLLAFVRSHGGDFDTHDGRIYLSYPAQEILGRQLARARRPSAQDEIYVGWQNAWEIAKTNAHPTAEVLAWTQAIPRFTGYLNRTHKIWLRSRQEPHYVLPHYSPMIGELYSYLTTRKDI